MKKKTNNRIKGIIAFALVAIMAGAFCGCGSQENENNKDGENANAANPIHEVASSDELCNKTGIALEAPEGAENVSYAYIEGKSEDENTAQVTFTLDGTEYTYRSVSTGTVNLDEYIKGTEYEGQDLAGAMMNGAEIGTDLSGMYGPWEAAALVEVQGREGVCAFNEGKDGVVVWLDVVPGVMYSLSVNDGANQDAMMAVAEKSFVPVQGEADGDE